MPTRLDRDKADYDEASVFTVASLVEAAIAQKGLTKTPVPPLCLLDPDGDLVRYLALKGEGRKSDTWPCYHSDLHLFSRDGQEIGVVGCAVGAPYAVLIAEELFYLGCETLISITSAGLLEESLTPPFFLLIEEAIRDEGTSHHYLPPGQTAGLSADLSQSLAETMAGLGVGRGVAWTTDAPFRETPSRIALMRSRGATVVEMEAAALYAYAAARGKRIICLAHVTNRLATAADDFNKGQDNSSERMIEIALRTWRSLQRRTSP
jgi:uridine phosphorylase